MKKRKAAPSKAELRGALAAEAERSHRASIGLPPMQRVKRAPHGMKAGGLSKGNKRMIPKTLSPRLRPKTNR